ncbi:hypothetical protein CAPTEDRAFT_135654 [Capitella teleta]|uniref:Methyltransferase type 11 domain-containing protein n=1 Tax=Capitella teleta TaxID=283909 RepID=R7UDR0_CAPTE|nr:hypothetical protein CAPTEDRAFT_135654 [Capitella teleta]|eukprot:ELU01397.1 hypothetical protein CAPTEDRAFT_135654 [Capitella teleta]
MVNYLLTTTAQFAGDFRGDCMADICAGPVILPSILGSRIFKRIHLYEYTPQCREVLNAWKNKNEGLFDLSSFMKTVADLEGCRSGLYFCSARTRTAITRILPLDLTNTPTMSKDDLPFDVIYSAWTLEAVAKTNAEYKAMVSLLGSWVRPGGGLLMMGSYGQTFYTLGEKKFHSLKLSESVVLAALDEAGFRFKRKSYFDVDPDNMDPACLSDSNGLFFISAVKNHE